MAKKKQNVSAPTKAEQSADELLSRTDQFLDKHLKELIIGVSVVIIVVLGFLGVRHFYTLPKEKKAETALFGAEGYFQAGLWGEALKGDSIGSIGFLEVVSDFGSTKAGNLAKAYAGICYYHLGEPNNAIDYLKKYKQNDNVFGPNVTCLMGDSYADLGNFTEAAKYFTKAATDSNNEVSSPYYLKKAALAYEAAGNVKEALNAWTKIEETYPTSTEGRVVEKEILRVKKLM